MATIQGVAGKTMKKDNSKARVARYRERKKEQGLIPITVMIKREYAPRIKQIVKELNAL